MTDIPGRAAVMEAPDFRALCVELVAIIEDRYDPSEYVLSDVADAVARARAALEAVPGGTGVSDEEVDSFIHCWWEQYGKGYLPNSSDKPLVQAALARYGTPAPVPATLPTDQELDAFWFRYMEAPDVYPGLGKDGFRYAARALLARYGTPAPGQESSRQFYVIDPGGSIDTFDDRNAAREEANRILDEYQSNAPHDGWPEDMELLSWGEMRLIEKVEEFDRKPPDPEVHDASWDYVCNYRMAPADALPLPEAKP